jgi:hypothetical protein
MKLFSVKTFAYSLLGLAFSASSAYAAVNVTNSCGGSTLGSGLGIGNADISAINELTGCNSRNINRVNECVGGECENGSVEILNVARADNDVCFEVESGRNIYECNTCGGDVMTGDQMVDIAVVNDLNSGNLDFGDVDLGSVSVDMTNYLTGGNSVNRNIVNVGNGFGNEIDVVNRANVDNNIDLYANTGRNRVEGNTKIGNVSTGSVDISGDIKNTVNSGEMNLSGLLSSPDVTATLENNTTGCSSENDNILNIGTGSGSDVTVRNTANINNNLDVTANTGRNTIGCNTCVGDVSTGDVSVGFSIVNAAN